MCADKEKTIAFVQHCSHIFAHLHAYVTLSDRLEHIEAIEMMKHK